MFWNIEDIQKASDEAVVHMGAAGRMIPLDGSVMSAAVLYTQEHGKIWYGDIDLQHDTAALEKLSAALEMPVFVMAADTVLTNPSRVDVTDAIAVASKQGFQILRALSRTL
jgi:hypothetical protein